MAAIVGAALHELGGDILSTKAGAASLAQVRATAEETGALGARVGACIGACKPCAVLAARDACAARINTWPHGGRCGEGCGGACSLARRGWLPCSGYGRRPQAATAMAAVCMLSSGIACEGGGCRGLIAAAAGPNSDARMRGRQQGRALARTREGGRAVLWRAREGGSSDRSAARQLSAEARAAAACEIRVWQGEGSGSM